MTRDEIKKKRDEFYKVTEEDIKKYNHQSWCLKRYYSFLEDRELSQEEKKEFVLYNHFEAINSERDLKIGSNKLADLLYDEFEFSYYPSDIARSGEALRHTLNGVPNICGFDVYRKELDKNADALEQDICELIDSLKYLLKRVREKREHVTDDLTHLCIAETLGGLADEDA